MLNWFGGTTRSTRREPPQLPAPKTSADALPTPATGAAARLASTPPAQYVAATAIGRVAKLPARDHAKRFIAWMRDTEWVAETGDSDCVLRWIERDDKLYAEILHADLVDCYLNMCAELGYEPHHWNTFAADLRGLLGEHKRYCRITIDGTTYRRRCYHLEVDRAKVLPRELLYAPTPAALEPVRVAA